MKYIEEDIELMLINHRENEGKLFEIELKIDEYKKQLEYAGIVYEDSEKEVIENMQLAGKGYDEMRSNTNKISDKVSSTVINYKKEQTYINKVDRDFLETEIHRLEMEKEELNKKIARVKNWLDKIKEKEAFILEEFYINNKGNNWGKVVDEYSKKYNKSLTDRQLRTTKRKAIQNVLKIVNI